MKLLSIYNEKVAPAFDVPAAAVGGGTGHFIADKEITGHMGVDIFIKVVVPIISGLIVPVFHKWFADRRDARNLRREELALQNNKKNQLEDE